MNKAHATVALLDRVGVTLASLLALGAASCASPARSPDQAHDAAVRSAVDELASATDVVDSMREIPLALRQHARCVIVVPTLIRGGLLVGARHGDGIVSCRTASGWSGPVFVSVTGGSAGLQIGVESSDVILLVMTDRGLSQLFRTSFALGADASVAAGPVGGGAQAGTDASMTAEILSYSRSRGLFAGAELGGSVLKRDGDAMGGLYGQEVDTRAVLAGEVPSPKEATEFLGRIAKVFQSAQAPT
jgi:lipid-binding SYLF domain-containing protein